VLKGILENIFNSLFIKYKNLLMSTLYRGYKFFLKGFAEVAPEFCRSCAEVTPEYTRPPYKQHTSFKNISINPRTAVKGRCREVHSSSFSFKGRREVAGDGTEKHRGRATHGQWAKFL
jgi:hypothetical protein